MSSTIKLKRRTTGGSGAPAVGTEGEVALNFSGGATAVPEFWAHGGTLGWLRVNPPVTVTTQSISLGTAADIGAAYTTWATTPANRITGNVCIASFTPTGGAAGAYVLTNPAAPGTASSWVSLGGAVSMAAGTDVIAGTDTVKALSSKALADGSTAASAGAADAGKYVRLDGAGKIAAGALPAAPVSMKGGIAMATALPATPAAGDSYFVTAITTPDASWGTAGLGAAAVGDMIVYGNGAWHLIPDTVDLNAYVPLAGTNAMAGNIVWAGAAASKAGVTIIDGKGGTIDAVLLDLGTF